MPAKMPIYLKSTNSKKGKKCRLRDILSPDMISPPLGDFRHTIHIGKGGECDAFGDMSFLQGKFELLPGKGGIIRPQYVNTQGVFTRANSASDASCVETPSPVLKNAISLPTIGGSQALTLPLISTTVFPMNQDPLDLLDEPSTHPANLDVREDLEILQMETLLQSISVFRSDPSPVPEEDEPLIHVETPETSPEKRNIHSSEDELETFLSVIVNENSDSDGNHSNGNNYNSDDYKQEMFSIQGDWADRDSGVEEGRLCDSDFELSKSKSHSQESLTQITGSIFSLELDLGPSILDDVLNIMNKPIP